MRAYEVRRGEQVLTYAGTSSDASADRKDKLEAAGMGPRDKSISVVEIDIPTAKPDLLAWLNARLPAPTEVTSG